MTRRMCKRTCSWGRNVTHVDLCTGIGGFGLAASWVWPDHRLVAACEIDQKCQAVIRHHWPEAAIHSDIHDFDGRQYAGVDLLTAGFPCQPYSVAGKRHGKKDDRALWPQVLRVIRDARPRWVVAENVAGIIRMELDGVLSDLEDEGYSCWAFVIPACAVDAPHRRDRVWIVANADGRESERRGELGVMGSPEGEESSEVLQRKRDGDAARYRGEDVADADGGRAAQSIGSIGGERRRFEDLMAADRMDRQRAEIMRRAQLSQVDLGGAAFTMKEGWHTKHNCRLFIVQMTERVDGTTFKELAAKARRLGGNYSSFVKEDAGFQFRDEESARRFMGLSEGNVSIADEVLERREMALDVAAERLAETGEARRDRGAEILNAPRKTNTGRRLNIARSVEGDARKLIQRGSTAERLAEALAARETRFLIGVRHLTDIEELETLLMRARIDRERQRGGRAEDAQYRATEIEDVDLVRYPWPSTTCDYILRLALESKNRPGSKLASARLSRYVREIGAMLKKRHPDWTREQLAEAGCRISDSTTIEALRCCMADDGEYSPLRSQLRTYDRLQRMGLTSESLLRAALREYLTIRAESRRADPVMEKERDLIGRKIVGFFPTPAALVEEMIELAEITEGMSVLEPSAGKGDIAEAVRRITSDVSVIEIAEPLREILEMKGFVTLANDFEVFASAYTGEGFDRIVMNPPFEHGQDTDHVRRAYDLLKPGGRLVAIMCEGPFFREGQKYADFRRWLDQVGAYNHKNEPDAFTSGFRPTGVQTRTVLLKK